jgi:soluble lytic murein transglycosylase-like protein
VSPRHGTVWLASIAALVCAPCACAGNQRYEPLAASVQTTLHAAVVDRASPRLSFTSREESEAWLTTMSQRLLRHMPDEQARKDLLTTVHYEAKRAGLDPQLVLGVIEVESRFRKYAVSRAGARGYMQVMPFWVRLIGNARHNLFNPRTNLRYGCVILRHYLDIERGNTSRALARYNGSLGKKSEYSVNVVRAWQTRWQLQLAAPAMAVPLPVQYIGEGQ